MTLVMFFSLILFCTCKRRKSTRRFSNNDREYRHFIRHLSKDADIFAKRRFIEQLNNKRLKQTKRIYKTAILSKLGKNWKDMLGAIPEMTTKAPSMYYRPFISEIQEVKK